MVDHPTHADMTAAIEALRHARIGHTCYVESFRHREHAAASIAAHRERAEALDRVLAWMEGVLRDG